MTWILELSKDNPELNIKYKEEHPWVDMISSEFVQPAQRTLRYGMLINELCKNINTLENEYKNNKSDQIQSNINRLSKLKDDLAIVHAEMKEENANFNNNIFNRIECNRKIEYDLFKLSTNPKVRSITQRLYDFENPPRFKEVHGILRKIKTKHNVNTKKLIKEALKTEKDSIDREVNRLSLMNDPDSRLKKLNREVALHLLTKTEGLSPKTQKAMIKLADSLCQDIPLSAQEIQKALKRIHLSKNDKIHHRRISRGALRNKIKEYHQTETNMMADKIVDKIKPGKPASHENILEYLNQLKFEWTEVGSTLKKTKDDPTEHNKQRIELVNNAIVAIKLYQEKDFKGDINSVYVALQTNLKNLENSATPQKLSDRTKKAMDQIEAITKATPRLDQKNDASQAGVKDEADKKLQETKKADTDHDQHSKRKKVNPLLQEHADALFTSRRHYLQHLDNKDSKHDLKENKEGEGDKVHPRR